MTYKSVLAVLDNSRHLPGVVSVAADIAQRNGAHLIGLYAVYSEVQSHELQDPWIAAKAQESADKLNQHAQRCEAAFNQYTRAVLQSGAEFRRADQDALGAVTVQSRYVDLVVIGQRDPEERGTGTLPSLVERAVLAVGRPVLVVPYYASAFPNLGQNVLVAWNGSREAVRAVHDALPLLERAKNVVVMAVNPMAGRRQHGDMPGADLAQFLARHGVNAEARASVSLDIGVGEELLARASDLGTDLLVMGAYGHPRLQELVMGGVTQTMMQHMTVPALMSH